MIRSIHGTRRHATTVILGVALGLTLTACGGATSDPGAGSPTTTQVSEEPTIEGPTTEEPTTEEPTTEEPTTEEDSTSDETATAPVAGPIASPCASPDDPSLQGLTVVGGDAEAAVVEKAQTLLELAAACDRDGLVALAGEDTTMLSLGGASAQDAFVTWDDADERIHAMVVVLSGFEPETMTQTDDVSYVQWPGGSDGVDDAMAARLVELGLYDEEQVGMMQGYGGYTGWRVVVEDTGRWSFMGAGD